MTPKYNIGDLIVDDNESLSYTALITKIELIPTSKSEVVTERGFVTSLDKPAHYRYWVEFDRGTPGLYTEDDLALLSNLKFSFRIL